MVIAVDAVGGDFFPGNPVLGSLKAIEENQSIHILLFGPKEIVQKELSKHSFDESRITVVDAPDIVTMDDSASVAIKSKVKSSINLGIHAHKNGECDAFVSAGNTGALLAASTLFLGKLEGVIRPTIAAVFPTVKGVRLLVDAGANLELKPEMYVQFGKMGAIFLEQIMDVKNPTVGLVNVGSESEKGTEIQKEAYKALGSELQNFIGNIEGKDILSGKADVFLTDGFTGNILLKFGESVPEALKMLVGKTIKDLDIDSDTEKKIYTALSKSLHTFDYEHVGGVPFLGVNGLSFVGHGGSSPTAIKNMILNAVGCVEHKLNQKVVNSIN